MTVLSSQSWTTPRCNVPSSHMNQSTAMPYISTLTHPPTPHTTKHCNLHHVQYEPTYREGCLIGAHIAPAILTQPRRIGDLGMGTSEKQIPEVQCVTNPNPRCDTQNTEAPIHPTNMANTSEPWTPFPNVMYRLGKIGIFTLH